MAARSPASARRPRSPDPARRPPSPSRDREARPKPASRRRRAPARAHQPRQGAVARDRVHEGRDDRLLRADRRRDPAAPARSSADPEALPERRRREVLLREALSQAPAGLGADGADLERAQRGRHRLLRLRRQGDADLGRAARRPRSEEHTSELHHEWISYAVFCLKKKNGSRSLFPHYPDKTRIARCRCCNCQSVLVAYFQGVRHSLVLSAIWLRPKTTPFPYTILFR